MIETIEKLVAKRTGMSPAFANLLANEIVDALEEKFTFQRKADSWDRKVALDIEERVQIKIDQGSQGALKLLRVKMAYNVFGMSLLDAKAFVEENWTNNGNGDVK